jgi:hypothetical protein
MIAFLLSMFNMAAMVAASAANSNVNNNNNNNNRNDNSANGNEVNINEGNVNADVTAMNMITGGRSVAQRLLGYWRGWDDDMSGTGRMKRETEMPDDLRFVHLSVIFAFCFKSSPIPV